MANADIALECGFKFQVEWQDRQRVNSDADKTLGIWNNRNGQVALSRVFISFETFLTFFIIEVHAS